MGVSTSAKLIYGYRLKTEDQGWLVKEIHGPDSDEWGLNLPWLADGDDFQSEAEDRLRASVGFDETLWDTDRDAWRQGRKEAAEKIGVEFEYGGYEFGDLFLSAKLHEADLGDVKQIDPGALIAVSADRAGDGSAAVKLARALEILGITPLQESPAWLLTACRG